MKAGTHQAEALRIVVTDPIISRFQQELRYDGGAHHWVMASGWGAEEQLRAVADADVVICSALPPEQAAAGTRLRLVHVTGAGYEKIALDALSPSAAVANTFHHARPIAEHVVMMTLMLSRRALAADRELRSGQWRTIATAKDVPFHPTLDGMVVGVIGLGTIGAEVARLAGALGMRVQAVRGNPAAPLPAGVQPEWVGGNAELPKLLETSDVVVVTVPLSEGTRGLIGAGELQRMKPSALLVNVARGPIVDQGALYAALAERRIAGAGIDVWWGTPAGGRVPPSEFPFEELDNVVLTPHHSGHARRTFERRAADIAANIANLAAGRPLFNVVRAAS
ncbi:D-isomer specific 2-hydroxyacid dehydrogenase [Arthrobacter crystallopoietes BAB-32]|uniref:D-isomer specific 2-hydroxyacid dehydrogenase n=1 Tax=Arthrobacter crystallopoietes BAB-32 TaxID=1246476 RepID=N1V096_9MICC|nr:2-hydroxyacid dehydrogenase [Arthrobacter crystallopoietes]EMY33454.1 D-isomer specific 2-hydroxyacid dehydrogenase [Arthrobacter crystallopoietes BAB-32]